MSRRKPLASLLAGFVLAFALAMGRLTRPEVVFGWLDVFGAWDVTLLVFCAPASLVYAGALRWARARERTGLGPAVPNPGGHVDAKLLLGASLFGVGWAIAGVCPGPALASLGAGAPWAITFVLAMAAGLWMPRVIGA
jgi:uncharacterized membrane protein YedE/YeeE